MPKHGQAIPRCPEFNSTYHSGCRCSFCRNIHRILRKQQRVRAATRARGAPQLTDRVDAAPSRELVLRAVSHGTTLKELERLTDVSSEVIRDLRDNRRKYVTRKTHLAINRTLKDNTDLRDFQPGSRVSAKYTLAMLHGLIAQGWTTEKQRELLRYNLGINGGFLRGVAARQTDGVLYENEQAMRWLVQQIGDTPGPSSRSRAWARNNGYFPCKHYDNNGDLIVSSLPKEMRQGIESV